MRQSAIPQMNVTERHLEPWERKDYTLEQEQKMFMDWALFFTGSQDFDHAAFYYDKALQLKSDNPHALYMRSICQRQIAHAKHAMMDALKASELKPSQPRYHLEIADALSHMNEFENALVQYYKGKREFIGPINKDFCDRIELTKSQLKDSCNDYFTRFFLDNRKYVIRAADERKQKQIIDKRTLWKRFRDEEKCDVLSILEKEEIIFSPLENARRRRSLRLFYQTYFYRSWKDIIFMRNFRDNTSWMGDNCTESTRILANDVKSKYDTVKRFSKMLHARSPIYHIRSKSNERNVEVHKEWYFNTLQYRTRRNMFLILREIKLLRQKGKIEQLAKYIETVMSEFVMLKNNRVMPWKFEFINDVYNTLALAFADRYIQKGGLVKPPESIDALLILLRIPKESKERIMKFEFGNKSTWFNRDLYVPKHDNYKKLVSCLEKRILFARYSIEKAYLWHEIARAHLKNKNFLESCATAKKAIDESNKCKNCLWAFLSQMLIVKSHAASRQIETCHQALLEAQVMSAKLKNEKLCSFVEMASQINDGFIVAKQKNRASSEVFRKQRSSSMFSVHESLN